LKRISALFLFILFNLSLLAQNTTRWLYDFERPLITLEGNYLLSSPTIDNLFINSYFKGDYLGDFLKKKTYNNLKPQNILGAQNNFKLSYVMHADQGGSTVAYVFSVSNNNIAALQCSDNVFKLAFGGNKQFAGETLTINDNGLSFISYSQLKGGIVKQYGNSRFTHTFKGMLSFNTGVKHNKIVINKGKFFTDTEGTLIDTELNVLFQSVKNNSPAFIKIFNGIGSSIDLYYNYKCDRGNNFTVGINDFGFIRWFKPFATSFNKDTAFVFEGIEIIDILDIEASTSKLNKDSINEAFSNLKENKPYLTYLPLSLHMYYFHEFSSRLEIGAGFKHYFNLWHTPHYFIDAKMYVLPQVLVAPVLSYGGYAKFNVGLNLGFNFKLFNIYAGTDYITPFLDNEKFRGKGYYFKITRKISYGPKSFESSKEPKISKVPRRPKYNADVFSNSIINKISKFTENDTIVKP